MTRICENGSFLAVKFEGAGGGGSPELTLVLELALRDGRPGIAQERQPYLLLVKMHALMIENAFKECSRLTMRSSTNVTFSQRRDIPRMIIH